MACQQVIYLSLLTAFLKIFNASCFTETIPQTPIFPETNSRHAKYVGNDIEDHRIHQNKKSRQIINWNRLWPEGKVYYDISPEFNDSMTELIYEAIEEISSRTCIIFKEHTVEPDYIYFKTKFGDGCHTHAGRLGGKQILNLDSQRCLQHGKIMHEILHSLGFHHEHQRPDRDNYIKINWNNIKPEDRIQLAVLDAPNQYLERFPYDYGSILHYGPISFYLAVDRDIPILESKFEAPNMGQRVTLSKLDVEKINMLYHCKDGISSKNI